MKNKIKVIHIITLLELGGAQQNTLFTVRHLNPEKYDVGLIAGSGGILDEEAGKIAHVRTIFVKNLVRPIRPWQDCKAIWDLAAILRREKPDIVHTHSSKAGIIGRIAAKIAGVEKIVHSVHGFGFNPRQKFFVRWLFIILEKWIAHFTDCLIAVSQDNIQTGLAKGIGKPEQYRLIRSGVDIDQIKDQAQKTNLVELRENLKIAPQMHIAVNIGPFKIQKNPLGFLDFAKIALQKLPNLTFLMVGDGGLRPQLEQKLRDLKLQDKVRLLGWRRDIPSLLALADCLVMTSLWEGLPRASVEALILGKPVFAYAVDGQRDIIQNGFNGYIVEPGQNETLAEKLAQTLRDPKELEKLKKNAQKTIDISFNIHHMVRQQEELYSSLLTLSLG